MSYSFTVTKAGDNLTIDCPATTLPNVPDGVFMISGHVDPTGSNDSIGIQRRDADGNMAASVQIWHK
jgi:hypothetical protein